MRHAHGFTLIELMLTLVIAAILLGVAVPNFSRLVESNRITAATNELVGAFNVARSEAVRAGGEVVVCASKSGGDCDGDWQDGWVVAVYVDEDGEVEINGKEADVIRVRGQLPETLVVAENNDITTITYNPRGMLESPSSASFEVKPKDCSGRDRREVGINAVGRVQMDTSTCS